MDVDVIVRTADELAAVVAADPLADMVTSGAKYVVVFLPEEPDPEALAELAERDFEPEQFRAHGREVYAWCPGGLQQEPGDRRAHRRARPPHHLHGAQLEHRHEARRAWRPTTADPRAQAVSTSWSARPELLDRLLAQLELLHLAGDGHRELGRRP